MYVLHTSPPNLTHNGLCALLGSEDSLSSDRHPNEKRMCELGKEPIPL